MRKNQIIIVSSLIIIIALVIGGISYHQATRFNANITINGTKVGGLTANQVIKKLKSTVLKNVVYVGQEQIFDGKDTMMGFTSQDLPNVKKILGSQWTFFPSSKAQNYSLLPIEDDQYRTQTMKNQIEEKLLTMNKGLKPPKDAEAHLEQGNIVVSKSSNGNQYDVTRLMKDYQNQEYKSEIHLNPVYIKPVKENSSIVKQEKDKLQQLLQQTVNYQVQDQIYSLKGSDLVKNASVSKDMKVTIDPTEIKNKIEKINEAQATLNKDFQFKTHTGAVIKVKGQTYGWALNETKESKRIAEAFVKGETTLPVKYTYGEGWSTYGKGYNVTTNGGIGDTYAEVSIKDQQIWLYKNGQLVLTSHVVTGKQSTGEVTPTGVWYIEYKESPSVLKGSEVGNPKYSVKVNYWAPFTLGGVGFHDASWRTNWASDAYLEHGSGGCVNTPPDVMKNVYDNLSENEPVVVY